MLSTAAALVSVCIALAQPPSDAELINETDRLAAETLSQPGAAGLSIAIAREGKVILSKGYGLAEIEHDVRANAESMFRAGSITKQFTAAAVMRLAERGGLGLDDPVEKHVPGYKTQGRRITIRHLLSHTSGIKNYTELKRVMVDEPEHEFSRQEMLDLIQDEPLAFEPGTRFEYSNTNYYLLGMIIERVSGKDYCEFLGDEFFGPLSLSRVRCDSNTEIIKGRAQGYTFENEELENDRGLATSTPFAAGMLIASAHDLVVWADALPAGKIVSKESYTLMSTPFKLADGSASDYGFGLFIDTLDGHSRLQHGGDIFGFNSMLARFPKAGLTIAVISNSRAISSMRLADSLSRIALGVSESVESLPLSDAEASRCEGVYMFPDAWGFTITRREGKMFSRASDDKESAMTYLGKGEFSTWMYDKKARLVFEIAGDGPSPTCVLKEGGGVLTAKRE